MITPQVSINGDSKQELLDQMDYARVSLLAAAKSMTAALPHPRNYQPNPELYLADRKTAVARIVAVQKLAEQYYQDMVTLEEGGKR